MPQTWLIVGASRGIGLEFATQLLDQGHIVIATARAPASAPPVDCLGNGSKLYSLTGTRNGRNLTILECDVSDEESIRRFGEQVRRLGRSGAVLESGVVDVVVLNAGVLVYPNRASEMSVISLLFVYITCNSPFSSFISAFLVGFCLSYYIHIRDSTLSQQTSN